MRAGGATSFEDYHLLGADRVGPVGQAGIQMMTAALVSGAQARDYSLLMHASASALTVSPVREPSTWGRLMAARRGRKRA